MFLRKCLHNIPLGLYKQEVQKHCHCGISLEDEKRVFYGNKFKILCFMLSMYLFSAWMAKQGNDVFPSMDQEALEESYISLKDASCSS